MCWKIDWFKGADRKKGDLNDFNSFIDNMPSGATGCLSIWWMDGGGHSLHWSKTEDGLQIEDGQTGTIYSSIIDIANQCGDLFNRFDYARLDNCEINWDALDRDNVIAAPASRYETSIYDKYQNDIMIGEEYSTRHSELDVTGQKLTSEPVQKAASLGEKIINEVVTRMENAVENIKTYAYVGKKLLEDIFSSKKRK